LAENFYTILTATGKAKLANSAVLGSKVNFKTLKVGDGKGTYYQPSENQTSLVNQVWSGNVSSISVDENNPNWIVIETLIPATIGGFFIREAGIFDEDDDLIAISKLSETYKPVVSEGSIKDLCIKIILEVSNVESVTLKIDPTVIVATKKDILVIESEIKGINELLPNLATKKDINILESEIEEIRSEMSNDDQITQAVAYGMNSVIKNNSKITSSPKFTIQGKTLINLLGKDGTCEDVSNWTTYKIGCSSVFDNSVKFFGTGSIKITRTSSGVGDIGCASNKKVQISSNKYYCISAYFKNSNDRAINATIYTLKGSNREAMIGTGNSNKIIISSGGTGRVFAKFQPSDLAGQNDLYAYPYGIQLNQNECLNFDGVMLEEITEAQYNNSNFTPSPYVESYTCLINPYIEIRHNNLVRNGNCEEGIACWTPYDSNSTLSLLNNKFCISTTQAYRWFKQSIKVKAHTDYYLCGNISDGDASLRVTDQTTSTLLRSNEGIFNTGSNTEVNLFMYKNSIGTSTFDSIMLIEGIKRNIEYKSCVIERVVIEGQFTEDDTLVYENGKISGLLSWKHKTLYGKDYDWSYNSDYTGHKAIIIPPGNSNLKDGITDNASAWMLTKPTSGVPLKYDLMANGADRTYYDVSKDVFISVADTESGWIESLNPNNGEVKAYMNGWKAVAIANYRYVAWVNVLDGSFPSCVVSSPIVSQQGGNVVTVSDGSRFTVGDYVAAFSSEWNVAVITGVSGNQITVSLSLNTVAIGSNLIRCDNGGTDTRLVNYCVNNVAPGYEGYKLHYKLANPEPVTDSNVHIEGEIPKIDVGDNYICVDSGMVLGEVGKPIFWAGDNRYYISDNTSNSGMNAGNLKYRNEVIQEVLKNNVFDPNWTFNGIAYPYGNQLGYILQANYDQSAIYTVNYKILTTIAPQIGCFEFDFRQDVVSALNILQEEVKSRQQKDSILDEIIDMSIYEKHSEGIYGKYNGINWLWDGGTAFFFQIAIPFKVRKRCIPAITINNLKIFYSVHGIPSEDVTGKVYMYRTDVTKDFVKLSYLVNDSTIISNLKTYGIATNNFEVIADCRGRL
jgi:hypothetical protein